MPFTPLHMGPGTAFKALLGRRFSLTVFGVSQIAMDLEPALRMARGDWLLHGFSHSYVGATLIGAVSLLLGRPLGQWLLRAWNRTRRDGRAARLRVPHTIPWRAAAAGAFVGTYSHVLLDSVMHADMAPWRPFADGNGLWQAVAPAALHAYCIGLGLAGGLLLAVAWVRRGRGGTV